MADDWPERQEFWRGKRVVVTGGCGFLGSYVNEKLRKFPLEELVLPRSRDYDLREAAAIERLLAEARPHVVIHLAANVGGIGANRARPAEFFYDNLMMGVPLLHASWKAGVEKFVAVGTVCAYPKFTPIPFREDDLWNGYPEETNAPYGLAKKMLLIAAQTYRLQYGFNSIYLLPANLYGPRDNIDLQTSHVIPALIRKCVEAREQGRDELVVWGTGSPTREFLYAGDCADGILLASERYQGEEPVNLGTSCEISIKDLVTRIVGLTGFQGRVIWDASQPDGQPRRCIDTSRAKSLFGFEASTSMEEGLAETVRWFEESRRGLTGSL
jgi:GDP-L-fucose synthase